MLHAHLFLLITNKYFSFVFSFPFLQATIYSYDHIFKFPGWLLIACVAGSILQPIAFFCFFQL